MRARNLALVLGILLYITLTISAEDLRLERMHVVDWHPFDSSSYNFVFRGDQPRNDSGDFSACGSSGTPLESCFAHQQLRDFMMQKAKDEAGLTLPSDFYLIDVSFIYDDVPIEQTDIKIEEAYWTSHVEDGELWHWPLYGEKECPFLLDTKRRQEKAVTFDQWGRDKIVEKLLIVHNIVTNTTSGSSKKPVVFYEHCEHGVDRTGEFSSSYSMMFHRTNFVDAMEFAWKVADRPILLENFCAAQWMCLYLEGKLGYTNMRCMEFIWP